MTERVYSEYRKGRNWSKKAIQYVKDNMYSKSTNEMSEHLGMCKSTLTRIMQRCGYVFSTEAPEDMVRWMKNRERNPHNDMIGIHDGMVVAPRKTDKGTYPYQMFIKIGWKKNPDGSDKVDKKGNKVGDWMLLSHYNWKKAGKPLAVKSVLDYIDGNWKNTSVENLDLVNRGEAIAEAVRRNGTKTGRPRKHPEQPVKGKNAQQVRDDKRKVREQMRERNTQGKTYNGRSADNRESAYRRVDKTYKTKEVDRTQMMYVRIDAKTMIEVPNNSTPEEIAVAKERYIAIREKRQHSLKQTGTYY